MHASRTAIRRAFRNVLAGPAETQVLLRTIAYGIVSDNGRQLLTPCSHWGGAVRTSGEAMPPRANLGYQPIAVLDCAA